MRTMTAPADVPALRLGWAWGPKLALFFLAYSAAAALAMGLGNNNMPMFWPPGGIYAGALMLAPKRLWPAFIAVASLAELAADLVFYQLSFAASFGLAIANTADAVSAAYLVRRRTAEPLRFETLHQHIVRVLLAFALGPAVGAWPGAVTLTSVSGGEFAHHWLSWWIGDALGMLVFAPLALLAVSSWRQQLRQLAVGRWLELGVLMLVSGALFHTIFTHQLPIAYASLLPLLWAALRFGLKGVVVFVAVLSLFACRYTLLGLGPFAYQVDAQLSTWMVELFVGSVGLSSLVVAALLQQRLDARKALQDAEAQAREELEQHVAERTAALRASEQRYRSLVMAASQSVWTVDASGHLSTIARPISGKSESELRGQGWLSTVHPDDMPNLAASWEAFKAAGTGASLYEHEHRVRDASGAWRNVLVRGAPVLEDDGSVREWIGTTTDITERKRAEQALRDSEERYRTLVTASRQSVWALDPEGNMISMSNSVMEHSLADGAGKRWLEWIHPDERVAAWEKCASALRTAKGYDGEQRVLGPDGTVRTVFVHAVPLCNADGTLRQLIGTTTDITQRKQAEDALRLSEERFRTLVTASQQSVWALDPRGNMIALSNSVLGRGLEECSGKRYFQWTHPDDAAAAREVLAKVVREPQPFQVELRVTAKDGSLHYLQAQGVPVLNPDGSLREFIGTSMDITKRKHAEMALRETAANLRRLAARQEELLEAERVRIAHDLHDGVGQLLNVAKLKLAAVDAGAKRAQVEEIAQIIDQTNAAIRTLEFELSPPVLRELGLVPALTWLADEMLRQYNLKVDISEDYQPIALCQLSRAVVFRAVRELLINVARHAGINRAEVSARRLNDTLELTIKDDGLGFAMNMDERGETRGLGLVGVRERIAAIGGSSEFHSAPGAGTVVVLRVPLALAAVGGRAIA